MIALSPNDPFFSGRPYTWDGRVFASVDAFESYLVTESVWWASGATIHHTWRPTVAQWKANTPANNLKGLIRTWRDDNGWTTGPNMVIGPDGIYLASGIKYPGIHAGVCNSTHIGIEIVGDYDNQQWQEPIRGFVYGTVGAIARKLRLTWNDIILDKQINGHRECLPNKSCPGKAISLNAFRATIASTLRVTYYTTLYDRVLVRQGPGRDFPIAKVLSKGETFAGDEVKIGENVNGENRWVHRSDALGFVHMGALKKI